MERPRPRDSPNGFSRPLTKIGVQRRVVQCCLHDHARIAPEKPLDSLEAKTFRIEERRGFRDSHASDADAIGIRATSRLATVWDGGRLKRAARRARCRGDR